MKKIILLLFFISINSYAQKNMNYLEYTPVNKSTTVSNEEDFIEIKGSQSLIETYTSLVDFQNGLSVNCTDPTITSENFLGGPGSTTGCGPLISSAGDGCFPPGELVNGFSVEVSNGANTVFIPSGSVIGNSMNLVGASSYVEITIVNFDPGVYAAALEIWASTESNSTEIGIFGSGGTLIETLMVSSPEDSETFFGFITDEPVTRIELQGENNGGELLGNLLFGADCTQLGIPENHLSKVSLYPNPVSDVINITSPASVEIMSVNIYDVVGKKMNIVVHNNQINMAKLSNGTYLVQIETNKGNITRKIMKE